STSSSTARSVIGSVPTGSASNIRPSLTVTTICSAPSMTWLLVTMCPCSSQTIPDPAPAPRSEQHTSELQSRFDLVCRLLPEQKKRRTDAAGHQARRDLWHVQGEDARDPRGTVVQTWTHDRRQEDGCGYSRLRDGGPSSLHLL